MKVLLVDDYPLFTGGLKNLLISHGIEVVGIASDGLEAVEMAKALQPDVILMDIFMPRCNGFTATRLIKEELPKIKVIILTVSKADEDIFEAIKSGASGYLVKDLKAHELVEMLRGLECGKAPFSPGISAKILERFAGLLGDKLVPAQNGLTPRQAEILNFVAKGMTYKEVGLALSISERTVKYHMRQIFRQLHLKNRTQLFVYVARMGSYKPY